MLSASIQRMIYSKLDERIQFHLITCISVTATVIGTYLTKPTDRSVLENFYKKTRPFGIWGPLKKVLTAEELTVMNKEHFYDIIALPFVMGWQITLFMLPMQFILRSYDALLPTLIAFVVCLTGIYFFWYRKLPE